MARRESERKRIVITGVTRGLGRALAEGLGRSGHVVAGCGRTAAEIESLRLALGPPHDLAVLDVRDDGAVASWAHRILSTIGAPDLLLNNAAVINRNAALWEVPPDEVDKVIDINIKGIVNVIRHFVPAMIERGRGVIVNLSSEWGRSTSPEVAPYCATKWAVEGLTRALAQELPRGLAAVPLSPGIINTDMLRSCFGDAADQYPNASEWARTAIPFLLKLGPGESGKPLTVA